MEMEKKHQENEKEKDTCKNYKYILSLDLSASSSSEEEEKLKSVVSKIQEPKKTPTAPFMKRALKESQAMNERYGQPKNKIEKTHQTKEEKRAHPASKLKGLSANGA